MEGLKSASKDDKDRTRIKLCGLSRPADIRMANELKPDYIGFVFASWSRRYVPYDKAAELRELLSPDIEAVGVFVDENEDRVIKLLQKGIIDIAQLHGSEDESYIKRLKSRTDKPVIKAVKIRGEEDIHKAKISAADHVLLDSGTGTGRVFDWELVAGMKRPYFLAGGLTVENVGEAIDMLHPFAVDISSGIETDGFKDEKKMRDFVRNVRKEAVHDKP